MIDEQETFRLFGYKPSDLSHGSNKRVVVVCDMCQSRRESRYSHAIKVKMCNSCSIHQGHSEETKQKMRKSSWHAKHKGNDSPLFGRHISQKCREATAQRNRERVWTDEARKRVSDRRKGRTASAETRHKMGESRRGVKNPNYGRKAAHGKGSWYICKNGDHVWLRSSWEVAVAQHLDNHDIVWDYEPQAYPVKYCYDGVLKEGTYRPDFRVGNELWEVKGYWRGDAQAKFNAFKEQYPCLVIRLLGCQDLVSLGVVLPRRHLSKNVGS